MGIYQEKSLLHRQEDCNFFSIIYHYDRNTILVKTLKNQTAQENKKTYLSIYDMLKSRGYASSTFILDNETSKLLLYAFEQEKLKCQLVSPNIHKQNAAKRIIETWKEHFIPGLSSVHP